MSYKSLVLSDNPSLFYLMDDTNSTILDYSSYDLDGTYTGTRQLNLMPLSCGASASAKITSSSYAQYSTLTDIATTGNDYNAFSVEFWFKPFELDSALEMPIVADSAANVGVFWDKTSIVFKAENTEIRHHVLNPNRVMHVVAVYSINSIQLYIDGSLIESKVASSNKFTSSEIIFLSKATSGSFLINSVAIYKYSLSANQIYAHYVHGNSVPAFNAVAPHNGHLFELFDNGISKQFSYSYPGNKSLSYFANNILVFDETKQSLKIAVGSGIAQEQSFEDVILIPSGPTIDDSYIEWDGGSLVTVETSIDGITYMLCENGRSIPQFIIGDAGFSEDRILYIRVTFNTSDDSKYNPELTYLTIRFYNNQKIYATNYPSYMSKIENDVNVTQLEVDLGSKLYPILSRNDLNGAKTVQDSGFSITTDMLVHTLEFFYTPYALTDSGLVSSLADTLYFASNYSWRNSGTIAKTNIAAIYVNGVDKTSETNVLNVFQTGQMHHVIIVFSDPISNVIKFNHSIYGAVEALYQNIATYENQFSGSDALLNYNVYTGNAGTAIVDFNMSMTEESVKHYNNDWTVIQNV